MKLNTTFYFYCLRLFLLLLRYVLLSYLLCGGKYFCEGAKNIAVQEWETTKSFFIPAVVTCVLEKRVEIKRFWRKMNLLWNVQLELSEMFLGKLKDSSFIGVFIFMILFGILESFMQILKLFWSDKNVNNNLKFYCGKFLLNKTKMRFQIISNLQR